MVLTKGPEGNLILVKERWLPFYPYDHVHTRTATSSSECEFHPNGWGCCSLSSWKFYMHTVIRMWWKFSNHI